VCERGTNLLCVKKCCSWKKNGVQTKEHERKLCVTNSRSWSSWNIFMNKPLDVLLK